MFRYAGRNVQCRRVLEQRRRQRCWIATIATSTKRRTWPVHQTSALLPRSSSYLPLSPFMPVHAHHAGFSRVGGQGGVLNTTRPPLRHLSTRRGLPPGRSVPEKIFAGVVVAVLAAWGLVFGAITLLLLPFVGIGLFLLRRNFQRGGVTGNVAVGLARKMARKMAERGAGGVAGGFGGGGGGGPSMQQAPTEGVLSSLLTTMLGGGLRGVVLVSVLRSEVKKRALRHPGLSSALGGGVEAFSDVEMSTVGSVGGAGEGGRYGQAPSRVTKARLRFSGRRAGPGGKGWAEVEVTEREGGAGKAEEEAMEFDHIFVTLDNGRKFDLTSDSFADDGNVEAGRAAQFLRRGQPSGGSGSGSKRASKVVRGTKKGKRPARDRAEGGDRPVEAEFRDK